MSYISKQSGTTTGCIDIPFFIHSAAMVTTRNQEKHSRPDDEEEKEVQPKAKQAKREALKDGSSGRSKGSTKEKNSDQTREGDDKEDKVHEDTKQKTRPSKVIG
jgi:hypothetical protein